MSTGLSIVAALWGVGAGVLAPGLAVVHLLGLGRGALERLVLGLAFGRLLLAAATLLATGLGAPGALRLWTPLAVAAWALAAWRARGSRVPARVIRTPLAALAPGLIASVVLVSVVVGRSGLEAASGSLFFFGRDASFDPLVYVGVWRQLAETGLPLTRPLLGGIEVTGQYVGFALGAGLELVSGANPLDIVFRTLPLLETCGLSLTAVALVRALGGNATAAGLAGVLCVLGSGAWFVIEPSLALLGWEARGLDTWSFFGPYLLPFNPLGPGLQTWLAVCLLVTAFTPRRLAPALAAGALVAALFETKLFVWLPVMAAVGAVALRPPAALRAPLRWMAATALALSLPSLAEKLAWSARLSEYDVGARACLGCLTRYLAAGALAFERPPWEAFRSFRNLDLLAPGLLAETLLATGFVFVLALGARLLAVPTLWRGAREDPGADVARAGAVAVHRLVGAAAVVGLLLAASLTLAPHYLNGAQFAATSVGLWLFAAVPAARWLEGRRWLALAGFLVAALLASAIDLERLGWGAPTSLVVSREERELLAAFSAVSRPGDVVLEPSTLDDRLRPSPIPALAGRAVHLSNRAAAAMLPDAERLARFQRVVTVFAEGDRAEALAAIEASGAGWVYAPRRHSLRFPPGAELEPVVENVAGVFYRVVAGAEASP